MYHDIAVPLDQFVDIFNRGSSFQSEEILKDALHPFEDILPFQVTLGDNHSPLVTENKETRNFKMAGSLK